MICNSWFDYEAQGTRIGCSSQPEGGVTGWWQQMVDANGWITHFLKEISTVCYACRKETKVQHSEVPPHRACTL